MTPRNKRKKRVFGFTEMRIRHHTNRVFEGDGEKSSRHVATRPVLILDLHCQIYEGHTTEANIAENLKLHSVDTARKALIETSPYSYTFTRKCSRLEKDGPLLTLSWQIHFQEVIEAEVKK